MAAPPGHTLILKALTMSDTSFGVSKSGRVVLPRAQVECCLEQLLRLGGASSAAASLKANIVPRLSVNLTILDEHNIEFHVTLKTWQNVVSGQHRPTFVLENTAAFMAAHPMKPGDILGICVTPDLRLQMRTDMRMNESPAAGLKRKLSSAAAATGNVIGNVVTNAAAVKRRGSVSLKRNSSIGPPTPAPSSPQQDPQAPITVDSVNNAQGVRFSSADAAAAAALVAMSSDTRASAFSLATTATTAVAERVTISSGLSGSSPSPQLNDAAAAKGAVAAAGAGTVESEMSTESLAVVATTPQSAKIMDNKTVTITTRNQQGRQGSLPPPPLPAPQLNATRNSRPLISPFQEALLAYSLDTVDQYGQQQQQQQQYQASNSLSYTHQQHNAQSSRFLNKKEDLSINMGWGAEHHHQNHDQSTAMRPVVQSGASVWPSMMSQAAMVVANALHNYRLSLQQQEQRQQQQNVRVVLHNQQQGVSICNAPSTDLPKVSVASKHSLPLAVSSHGGGGQRIGPGIAVAGPVEGLLRHFVH